jgi:hypothetical protein
VRRGHARSQAAGRPELANSLLLSGRALSALSHQVGNPFLQVPAHLLEDRRAAGWVHRKVTI